MKIGQRIHQTYRPQSQTAQVGGVLFRVIVGIMAATAAVVLLLEKGGGLLDSWGKPITLTEKTPLAAILKNPERFRQQPVRVEGTIAEICPKQACWFQLADGAQRILVNLRLSGHPLAMRQDAVGRVAVVQGRVYQSPEKLVFIVPTGISLH